MKFGTITIVGTSEKELTNYLRGNGYIVNAIPDLSALLAFTKKFDLLLISSKLISDLPLSEMERLYFICSGTPGAIIIHTKLDINDKLLEIIRNSTLDFLYHSEISNGLMLQRIDKLLIQARLNIHLSTIQEQFNNQEILESKLSLREQIITRERELNANIIASITSALLICDTNGNIIIANDPSRKLLGNSCVIGATINDLPANIGREITNLLENKENQTHPTTPFKISISEKIIKLYHYQMFDYEQKLSGHIILINDITKEEQINMILYRSEKLASMGTMLSGIAHELRNPLTIISARTERGLSKKIMDKEWLKKTFIPIKDQTKRCADIVNSLLNFTKMSISHFSQYKVHDIMEEALNYISYQNIFTNITLIKNWSKTDCIYGDRSRFVQIFLNIITNAVDAMDGNGTLTISCDNSTKDYTIIKFNDNGSGIPKAIHRQVYDPFFTTKDPGKGTGLGLAIVFKIVEESNGEIWFSSNHCGTTFFVKLPTR